MFEEYFVVCLVIYDAFIMCKVQIGPLRCWPGGLCLSRSIGDMDVGNFIVPIPFVKQVKVSSMPKLSNFFSNAIESWLNPYECKILFCEDVSQYLFL
jgi:hypothetical protein